MEWKFIWNHSAQNLLLLLFGTTVAQWLRCCATNRKVAGSIPAGVIEIFYSHKILPIIITIIIIIIIGTAVAQWLRCCATIRKVAGSIPDGVIGIFHWHNPSDHTMALASTQPLNRNEYQEYFLGVKSGRCVWLTTYHHPGPFSRNLGTLTSWNPLGTSGL